MTALAAPHLYIVSLTLHYLSRPLSFHSSSLSLHSSSLPPTLHSYPLSLPTSLPPSLPPSYRTGERYRNTPAYASLNLSLTSASTPFGESSSDDRSRIPQLCMNMLSSVCVSSTSISIASH